MRGAILCIIVVAACGYPPLDPGKGVDASTGHDGNTGHDGGGSDGNSVTCASPSTYGSPTATGQLAAYYAATGSAPEEIDVIGEIKSGSPGDYFEILMLAGTPQFPGAHVTAPVTIPLTGTPDLTTCGGCVLVMPKCPDPTAPVPHPAMYYMPTSGTLTIDSVESNAIGTLTNATFVHVSIDENTDATTVVNDGCTTKIDSVSFNVTIVDMS